MKSATEIAETNSFANTLKWAAEVLQKRFAEVISSRNKALDSTDIEGVHEMRVAIRRLRSALRDFSPLMRAPFLKKPKKDLKDIAQGLGRARDEDVALAALEKLLTKAKNQEVKKEIARKIEKRQVTRRKRQNELEKILDVAALKNLQERFARAIEDVIEKNQKFSSLSPTEAGREIISRSLTEFCDLSGSLYDPFNQKELHELRIAAKRLRYVLELFSIFWGEKIIPFAKEISEMQTFLGELHDCDIWIENLSRQLSKTSKAKQPADFWLLSRFTKERTKNYRASLRLWSKWQKNKFIKRLREVLKGSSEVVLKN